MNQTGPYSRKTCNKCHNKRSNSSCTGFI